MSSRDLWVIERRKADGSLDLKGAQPEEAFGPGAYLGLSDWSMSRVIYARLPEAVLRGDQIAAWPGLLDPAWIARPKTW